MIEPKPEQIALQIIANLNAIVGDGSTYWYTAKAVRADTVDLRLLDSSLETVYALTTDRKEEKRASNDGPGCIIDTRAFFTLTLLSKLHQATDNPFTQDGIRRETVQERMCADVRKKLRADPRLGGLSIDLTITDSEENPNETAVQGWALAFMRITVRYHYVKENPAA